MGNYTVIADVGQALVQILQKNLCPEVLLSQDSIGLCAPSDRGNMMLGLHLYDIVENHEILGNRMHDEGPSVQHYPSLYLTLFYMVTAYSKADVKFRAAENQRILGKVIETFRDYPAFSTDFLSPINRGAGLELHIEMMNPDMEERRKIWNASDQEFQTSLFYRIYPVELESTRMRRIQRVVDMDVGVAKEG